MQNYSVELQSEISTSYRSIRAANSLDIDIKKKSKHSLLVRADLETPYNVGLIIGSSGSGKTTLAKSIFGHSCFDSEIDSSRSIIDQFPEELSYDQCAEYLNAIGLTSVPCWIRPVYTLSNGQKTRAEAALNLAKSKDLFVMDEFTSVVDRTVAKAMSHCVQKYARKFNKRIVLLSCHYDLMDWLNPDWIIDCNSQKFIDRRLLCRNFKREETLQFDIRQVDKSTWKYFSKYHYLSDKLPGGLIFTFGIFHKSNQVGFQCFANYVPKRKNEKTILHSNRTVIHPDYVGLGLGIKLINETSKIMANRDYRIMAKFSSIPVFKALIKDSKWKLLEDRKQIGRMSTGVSMKRQSGFRENVRTFSFEFVAN